jgi:hypothetical protein
VQGAIVRQIQDLEIPLEKFDAKYGALKVASAPHYWCHANPAV